MRYSNPRGYPILEASDVPDLVNYFPFLVDKLDDDMVAALDAIKVLGDNSGAPARLLAMRSTNQTYSINADAVIVWEVATGLGATPGMSKGITLAANGTITVADAGLYAVECACVLVGGGASVSSSAGIRYAGQIVSRDYGQSTVFARFRAVLALGAGATFDVVAFTGNVGQSAQPYVFGTTLTSSLSAGNQRATLSVVRLGGNPS